MVYLSTGTKSQYLLKSNVDHHLITIARSWLDPWRRGCYKAPVATPHLYLCRISRTTKTELGLWLKNSLFSVIPESDISDPQHLQVGALSNVTCLSIKGASG